MKTLESIAEQYGDQNLVNFIYNRHCSRFDPENTGWIFAVDVAWQYHVQESEIIEDFERVESYGDLEQYFRR